MAHQARPGEQVSVAELLVRSAAPREVNWHEDTVVLPRARHRVRPAGLFREKPLAALSLGRTRVFAVVAGAFALAGGMGAAVSTPVERSSEAVWPPVELGLPMVIASPSPAGVPGVPGVPAKGAPDSVTPAVNSGDNSSTVDDATADSGKPKGPRGKYAKTAKVVKALNAGGNGVGKGLAQAPGQIRKVVAPIKHEIPEVPLWFGGFPFSPVSQLSLVSQGGQTLSPVHHDSGGFGGGGGHCR